ncbi:MAG: SGNH/GDSL hydrolase family protein, partial [Planctomycetota bacterium]
GVGVGYSRGTVIHATYWLDGERRTGPASKRLLKDDAEACGLIVGKITWGEGGGADKLEIYMPDKNLDPGPVQSEISVDLDQKTFKYLAVQMKEPHTHIDEFRFGATYADVTSDTIAKLLHGLSIEDAVGRPERDGYRLSLGVLKRFAEGHDAAKVTAKKLATLGGSLAAGSQFDASLRKQLKAADGYTFAGRMGFASSRRTVAVARRSLKGALAREKPEVVRICIGAADIARNLPANSYREALGALVDEVALAGAVPVLHTLPVRTVSVPKDKKQLDAADPATKAVWALSRAVRSYNDAIAALGAARKVPVVDAWSIVNKNAEARRRSFSARGGLGREGCAAINASFLRLYRILERGVMGRETEVPARGGP